MKEHNLASKVQLCHYERTTGKDQWEQLQSNARMTGKGDAVSMFWGCINLPPEYTSYHSQAPMIPIFFSFPSEISLQ